MSLQQIDIVTWLYQNHKDESLKTKKAWELYCEENQENTSYDNFTSIVQKLKSGGAALVESPEYGKIQLTDKGKKKADLKLNPEKYESVEKDEDRDFLHWATEELTFFFMENYDEEISKSKASGEDLEVHLSEIEKFNFELVDEGLEDNPKLFMDAVNEAFSEFVEEEHGISVRIVFDTDSYVRGIGSVKQSDKAGVFLQVDGMIRLCEDLVTKIVSADFRCTGCGEEYRKAQDKANTTSPYRCDECESKHFKEIDRHYKDYLEFELSSNDVKDDSLFCRAELSFLFDGHRDALQTGRRVNLGGFVTKEKISKNSEEFRTVFNVIGYQAKDKKTDFGQVDKDVKQKVKKKVEKSDNPFKDFALSIAPQIREMDLPKRQVAASLIGGTPFEDKREYGRIHACFYSNPGMGKSALIDEVNDVFGNVHSADNNSSGVGLTGSVTQTEDNRWRVTAGTMVFADKGVLTIDEFDKVDGSELGSLNTAMESGYIKINKAAQAKLPARASVIVAGNFEKTLDQFDEVEEHLPDKAVGFSDRFALMSAITDQDTDEVSNAIMDKYSSSTNDETDVFFDEEELVVYRNMTKRFYPTLSMEARNRLNDFITAEKDVAESKDNTEFQGDSNRFIEDLSQLTMMFARSRLASKTTAEDAENAYELFRECRETLGNEVGDPSIKAKKRKKISKIKEKYDLLKDDDGNADVQDIVEKVSLEDSKAEDIIDHLKQEGEMFEPSQGEVQLI